MFGGIEGGVGGQAGTLNGGEGLIALGTILGTTALEVGVVTLGSVPGR
jgi:hypothetical protein